jgi:transcriptional regulator with XRE-family HTH domain
MIQSVLAENLAALMAQNASFSSQAKVAARAGVDQTTIGRILAAKHAPTLDVVEKLAEAFGLATWQILVPGMDPRRPPTVR